MSWPSHYDNFFNAVRGLKPRQSGKEWDGCCPAHDDKHQSLSIKLADDGKLLVRCMAGDGCAFDAIVKAANLKPEDLFPPKDGGNGTTRHIVHTYDYIDKENKLRLQVVRYDPKDFRQRQPNPKYNPELPESKENPKWIWNLDGVTRILYRLPELVKAINENPKRWVFVVEGEKDVDTLWSLGFAATCNPMGAGKWLDDYSAELRGCNVCLIPDEDPMNDKTQKRPGIEHAKTAAASLATKAGKLIVARLPGKDPADDAGKIDVTRWLDAMLKSDRQDAVKKLVNDHKDRDHADVLAGKDPPPPKLPPATPSAVYVAGKLLGLATRLSVGAKVSADDLRDHAAMLTRLAEPEAKQ